MVSHLLPFEKRNNNVIVKNTSETSASLGKIPSEMSVKELLEKGIIVLDKPSGPTSHQAVDYLKKILKISKAGHSGTLDPGVTGVLPVAIEGATRITNALLTAGKEYVCLMHLHGDVSRDALEETIKNNFMGTISQLPPKKSAVKRQIRERSIYYFEILEMKGRDVLFVVGCQAGTYIRKLVHDIGISICGGAHMVELVRTKAGPFRTEDVVSLQNLADAFHYYNEGDDSLLKKIIFPVERGIEQLKKIWIHDAAVDSLCHGAFLKVPGISKLDSDIAKQDIVAVMTLKGELVLVGEALLNSNNMMKLAKGIAVKTSQVFMKPGTYSKN